MPEDRCPRIGTHLVHEAERHDGIRSYLHDLFRGVSKGEERTKAIVVSVQSQTGVQRCAGLACVTILMVGGRGSFEFQNVL